MGYILGPERAYHIVTVGPMYAVQSYLDPFGTGPTVDLKTIMLT